MTYAQIIVYSLFSHLVPSRTNETHPIEPELRKVKSNMRMLEGPDEISCSQVIPEGP